MPHHPNYSPGVLHLWGHNTSQLWLKEDYRRVICGSLPGHIFLYPYPFRAHGDVVLEAEEWV